MDAAGSTFRLEVYAESEMLLGSGTAWVAAIQGEYSYLISAGHVCSNEFAKTYKLHGQDDTIYDVEETMHASEPDLCLLRYKGMLARPLLIANRNPHYGELVSYVGAPFGMYGNDTAPYFTGHYMGSKYAGMPTAPGASGSAIWTPNGVFGVLVTVDPRFHHVTGFVPRQDLVNFLALAGFSFGPTTIAF